MDGEYVIDLEQMREQLTRSESQNELSLDAFDNFFGRKGFSTQALLRQQDFSAMVRASECKLLGGVFKVVDQDCEESATEATSTGKK